MERQIMGEGRQEPLSPLGELYRREVERLARQWPALEARERDRLIVRMLARLFLDADATDLARAMAEGNPLRCGGRDGTAADDGALVAEALAIARDERRPHGG